MASDLNNRIFRDDTAARAWLEGHLWPDGPVCGHCGALNEATALQTRPGWYQCNACRAQFSVTVGTVFERSHIPLSKWLMAAFLLCASKKGISTHQMRRMIGVSYKSTWFMMHRLREAARDGTLPGPLGGRNKVVETDETFDGGKAKNRKGETAPKEAALSLIERGGKVRLRRVADVTGATLRATMATPIDRAPPRASGRCEDRRGIFRPWQGQPLGRGIRPRLLLGDEPGRGLFSLKCGDHRRLPPRLGAALSPLF
jgi:transposase-like protein